VRTEAERFDRVLEHPTYKSAPDEPVLGLPLLGIADVPPSAIVTAGFSLLVTAIMILKDPFSTANQIIIGLLLGVFGWALYMSLKQANAVRDAPLERVVAVVVKERQDHKRRLGDRRDSVRNYVIVQTRDGQRRELFAPDNMTKRYAIDDIGIAYVKADVLVDFIRVDV
jgi:hypothetical protein